MRPIRNSAKAVVIQGGRLLVVRISGPEDSWYLLPGGGQEPGETLHDALRRECLEEASARVVIGDLIFMREYISKNHQFANQDPEAHQIEFMFRCELDPSSSVEMGPRPDAGQSAVRWIELDHLLEFDLYPLSIRPLLMNVDCYRGPVYLGEVN